MALWIPPGAGSLVVGQASSAGGGDTCTVTRQGQTFCKSGCCCSALLDVELRGGGTDTICVPPGTEGSIPCDEYRFFQQFDDAYPAGTHSADSPWTTYWVMDLSQLPEGAIINCIIIEYLHDPGFVQGAITDLFDYGGGGVQVSTSPPQWEVQWGVSAVRDVRAAVAGGATAFGFWMTVVFNIPPICYLVRPHAGQVVYCSPTAEA